MIGRTSFPECPGTTVEPGMVIAGRYVLLRVASFDPRPSWVARDTRDDTLCTLHLMEPAETDVAREAFEREMREAKALDHPQLAVIRDYGADPGGLLYVAEECLAAATLAERLEGCRFDTEWKVELIAQLLRVLEVVHAAGLTHGDLHMRQLLVRAGADGTDEIVLRGLGRARFAPVHVAQPAAGPARISAEWVVGDPEYASPEQICGDPHDARSDLYAVGVLMFRLLTGCSAFAAPRAVDLAWMQRFALPRPLSHYVEISPELERVCLKALSKTPELRFQSATEMLAALAAAHPAARSAVPERAPLLGALTRRISTPPLALPAVAGRRSGVPGIEARPLEAGSPRRSFAAPVMVGLLALMITGVVVAAGPEFWTIQDTPARARAASARNTADDTARASKSPATAGSADDTPSRGEPVLGASEANGAPRGEAAEVVGGELTLTAQAASESVAASSEVEGGDALDPARDGVAAHDVELASVQRSTAAADDEAKARATDAPARSRAAPRSRTDSPTRYAGGRPASGFAADRRAAGTVGAAAPGRHAEPPRAGPASRAPLVTPPQPPKPTTTAAAFRTYSPAASLPPVSAPVTLDADEASPPMGVSQVWLEQPAFVGPVTLAPEKWRPTPVDVRIGSTRAVRGAISAGSLRDAVNLRSLERCYQLAAASSPAIPGTVNAELEIETELSGRIASAKLHGDGLPPKLGSCVEDAVRFGRVRDADTGAVHAIVEIHFQRR